MQNVKRGRLSKFELGLRFVLFFPIKVTKKKTQICLSIM